MEGPWGDIEDRPRPSSWPALQDARVRPGAKVEGIGSCTTNFVFRSPDNSSLYVGTAGHCFSGMPLGTMATIDGIRNAGRLAYCSWGTMEEGELAGCPDPENGATHEWDNDFALVELRPDLRDLVHPAMRTWGGPTGLAHNVTPQDRAIMYGNSPVRDGFQRGVPDQADAARGYVVEVRDWISYVDLVGPGVPGDSGSGLMDGDGKAFGVMRTSEACVGTATHGSTNGVTNLAPALAFANDRTKLEVELATWPLSQEPTFPRAPASPVPSQVCSG